MTWDNFCFDGALIAFEPYDLRKDERLLRQLAVAAIGCRSEKSDLDQFQLALGDQKTVIAALAAESVSLVLAASTA